MRGAFNQCHPDAPDTRELQFGFGGVPGQINRMLILSVA